MRNKLRLLLWIQLAFFALIAAHFIKQYNRWDNNGKLLCLSIVMAALIISITWVMKILYDKEE